MDLFTCVFVLWLTTSTGAAQPGSGQGSGPEVTYLPISTATQPLMMFSSPTPIPAASDMPMKPRPLASITDKVAAFSTVPVLLSSLTPSQTLPLTSTPLFPPSPFPYTSIDFQLSSTEISSPMVTSFTAPRPSASLDENNVTPSSTQPLLFLPLTSIDIVGTAMQAGASSMLPASSVVFLPSPFTSALTVQTSTSSQTEFLLPQLTPTPSRQVVMTEALLEFPDFTSTEIRQPATSVSTPTISELTSTSDAVVIFPELTSTQLGAVVSSLPGVLPQETLAPSDVVVLNTQSIPGFSELFLSQTAHSFVSTEAVMSRISASTTVTLPGLTSVQTIAVMTSQPVMLVPQPSPDTTTTLLTTSSLRDILTSEVVVIFPAATSTPSQSIVTSQPMFLAPEMTPSPNKVISSSEAIVLFPESRSIGLTSEAGLDLTVTSSDERSPSFPTTFISRASTVVPTPVMERATSPSTPLIPPMLSTPDQFPPLTSSRQATPTPQQSTPTPQVPPTSLDMLLLPFPTSEIVSLRISTLIISPTPITQSLSTTQDSTDSIEITDVFIIETTELLFPVTSLPSAGILSPVLSTSTPTLTQVSTPVSTDIQSLVDQLTPTSSVPLFLLPLSSSSRELIAMPTSSLASRPISTLASVIPIPLPSLLLTTITQSPLPPATPTSVTLSSTSRLQPPPSSESDVFLIETPSSSSFVVTATSAINDLRTSIDLLIPFPPTTEVTISSASGQTTFAPSTPLSSGEVTFAPTPSPSGDLTISPSTTLQGPTAVGSSSSIETDSLPVSFASQSPVFPSLPPLSSSAEEVASVPFTVTEQLFFPTASPLLPSEPSLSTPPLLFISPSSAVVSLDDIIMTSFLSTSSRPTTPTDVPSSTIPFPLPSSPSIASTSSQLPQPDSSTALSSLEISTSVDVFEAQDSTVAIEITATLDGVGTIALSTVAIVTSTSAESLVTVDPSPSLSIAPAPSSTLIQPTPIEPISPSTSLEQQPPSFTPSVSSEDIASSFSQASPSQPTSSEPLFTDTPTSSLTQLISSAPLSAAASQASSTTQMVTSSTLAQTTSTSSSPLAQTTSQTSFSTLAQTTSQTSFLTSLQPTTTQLSTPAVLIQSPSSLILPLQSSIQQQPTSSSTIDLAQSSFSTTISVQSSAVLPPQSSTQQASAVQPSATSPSQSTSESPAPIPTPSPTPFPGATDCPSLLVEGETIPENSIVQLRLGLTVSQHSLIAMATSPERCELEAALASAIFGNGDSSFGRVARRQASGIFDADITDVGPLSTGTSIISFYILNSTDALAPPTFVPAATVLAAIQSRNLTQVLTYPIIGVEAVPPSPTSLVVPLAAGLGVALFLLVVVAVAMVLCVAVLYYNAHKTIKVQTLRGAEAASTFARTNDFGQFSGEQSSSSGAAVTKETVTKKPSVSISQLANGWVEGGEATPTLDRETPSSRQEHIPAGLFERVAHYESATPSQPSPSSRALKMKFRNAVAPSPSTSHKSHSSVDGAEPTRAVPSALRPQRRSGIARETVQSKEDDLRMQEQREEEELKQRRKATLERLMLQSRQRDTEIRSRTGSRRRKRRDSISMETRVRPSTYGGSMPPPRWEPELDAAMGDVDSSSPFATPHPADVMATTPRPTTRPSTKRRLARRKGNKIAPGQTTDDYDSTDHAPHPYHMMMDPRGGSMDRKVMRSRAGSRMKHGRSQRGRPFSREQGGAGRQSTLGISGRRSKGVATDIQRELAWMDTPGGVQLMRIQPILPAAAVAAPTFTLPPPHPSTAGGQLISVQPRPHPKALTTPPHLPRHSTLDNLPTLAPPATQNFTHKQLETLWREIEKFQLDQTMRRESTAAAPTKATPTEQPEAKQKAKSTNAPQTTASEVGEAGVGGERDAVGEAIDGEDAKLKDKEKQDASVPQDQGAATASQATAEHPPATPAPPPHLPDIDSSYSSAAAIQELLHQAFSASQSQGGGGGAGQPWAPASSTYQDSLDSTGQLLRLSGGGGSYHATLTNQQQPPPGSGWHSVVTSQPPQPLAPSTQIYAAPPTHYSGLPGQLVWAPPDPHSFTPLHTQVISPAQLTQLRQQPQPTYHHHDYDLGYTNDLYHTPPAGNQVPRPPSQQYFSPYSRYRRHDPFS